MQCNIVEYISYNMGNRDLPDIYTLALGPAAFGLRCIYQANPSCPCYNLYIYVTVHAKTSLVRTKIEINILSPAYSYTH